jgi:hypothetical protein
MSGDWIEHSIKHKGSLTRAAKKHGRSTSAEAKVEVKSPNKKIASRGRLALRFMGKAKHGNLKKAAGHKKSSRKRVSAKG